jgi:hypothetical protein
MSMHAYDFIPAPLWILTTLHLVTLTLHFVAMNLLAGGAAVLAFLWARGRSGEKAVGRYTRALPSIMAATITFGVAPLLFVQLVYPRQIYGASITSGWFWFGIIPAVTLAYYLVYAASTAKAESRRVRWYLLGALAVFFYVSFVYSSVFSMGEVPPAIAALYGTSQAGLVLNPHVGTYLARWGHMLLGALTLAGFFLGVLAGDEEKTFRTAKRIFLWAMVGASVLGLVYLVTLGKVFGPFLHSAGLWAVVLGILLSLGALHFFFTRRFWISGTMVFVSVLAMVFARHEVRLLRLAGSFDPASVPVHPQWGVFALFLLFFVVALALLFYMARAFFFGPRTTDA